MDPEPYTNQALAVIRDRAPTATDRDPDPDGEKIGS